MSRWRRVAVPAFLLVLGLIWAAVHALAHDLATQPAAGHHPAGDPGAKSYFAYLPTSLALCLILAAAIAAGAALGKRWAGSSGRSVWLFGLVPLLGFAADTVVELTGDGSRATATAALVPVFVIGLLAQIPIALVAVRLAGRILWLVEQVAFGLRKSGDIGRLEATAHLAWTDTGAARGVFLAGARRSRAPPPLLEL